MVSASAAISPLASTVSFWFRSPLATAVTTLAMPRTWPVRLPAMKFTLSVRSFQVPATPRTSRLAAELAFGADLAGHARHFRRERLQLVHHRVDRLLQLEDLALHVHRDLLRQVAVGHCLGHVGDIAHLAVRLPAIKFTRVGQVLPGAGHALHVGLATQLALGAHLACDARHFRRERRSWSTIVLIVFFSSRISPFTSTVIFFDRSPAATAVVTSAMLRTWPVRLPAMKLT